MLKQKLMIFVATLALFLQLVVTPARADGGVTAGLATVGKAYSIAKGAYDAYKQGKSLLNPEPTTAQLIEQAVNDLSSLFVGIKTNEIKSDVRAVTRLYVQINNQSNPSSIDVIEFDKKARRVLDEIEGLIVTEPRFADQLGVIYNLLLPSYLQIHLVGDSFGIIPIGHSLEEDVLDFARTGFQINYDLVGGKSVVRGDGKTVDTTRQSILFSFVHSTSKSKCRGKNGFCDAFFQTNASVQAAQYGAYGLFRILENQVSKPAVVMDMIFNAQVAVNVPQSYQESWHGYPEAIWTSMQEWVNDKFVGHNSQCPDDHAAVGIRVLPKFAFLSLLCQKIPGEPEISVTSSFVYRSTESLDCVNSNLCGFTSICPEGNWAVGGVHGEVLCKRHEYNGVSTPIQRDCIHDARKFKDIPEQGVFMNIPAGRYLNGYDLTIWHNWKTADLFHCSAEGAFVTPESDVVPLHRYFRPGSGHFYTTNFSELGYGRHGFFYEGKQGYIMSERAKDTVPLYRYVFPASTFHFYTTNFSELHAGRDGWVFQGVQGYIFPQHVAGSAPLYRYFNTANRWHFYTTSLSELGNDLGSWILQGTQGYILTRDPNDVSRLLQCEDNRIIQSGEQCRSRIDFR